METLLFTACTTKAGKTRPLSLKSVCLSRTHFTEMLIRYQLLLNAIIDEQNIGVYLTKAKLASWSEKDPTGGKQPSNLYLTKPSHSFA